MLESQISRQIVDYLRIYENTGKLIFQRNNSFAGKIERRNGTSGYIKNSKKGSPDFYVFVKGAVIGLEAKTEKGRQSDEQKEFQIAFEKLGHQYFIVRDVDDVDRILNKYI